jgi:isopentenyldiphosphate isomerase
MDDGIHYEKDFGVKKKKRAHCKAFFTLLHFQFDVGIWALIGEALVQQVAKFFSQRYTNEVVFFVEKRK